MARHTAMVIAAMACQTVLWLFIAFSALFFSNSHWLVIAVAFFVFVFSSFFYMVFLIYVSLFARGGWIDESRKENLSAYNLAVLRVFKGEMDAIDFFAFIASVGSSFFIGVIISSYITADFFVRNHKRIDSEII